MIFASRMKLLGGQSLGEPPEPSTLPKLWMSTKRQLRTMRDGDTVLQLGVVKLRRWEASNRRVHAVLHVQHRAGLTNKACLYVDDTSIVFVLPTNALPAFWVPAAERPPPNCSLTPDHNPKP